jgi:hypothetical protein
VGRSVCTRQTQGPIIEIEAGILEKGIYLLLITDPTYKTNPITQKIIVQ